MMQIPMVFRAKDEFGTALQCLSENWQLAGGNTNYDGTVTEYWPLAPMNLQKTFAPNFITESLANACPLRAVTQMHEFESFVTAASVISISANLTISEGFD